MPHGEYRNPENIRHYIAPKRKNTLTVYVHFTIIPRYSGTLRIIAIGNDSYLNTITDEVKSMRYTIVTTIIFALALTFALLGCENAGENGDVEIVKIADNPPLEPPEEMKNAETAYTFLVENWVEDNYSNVFFALDAESKDYIGMAWESYVSAREVAYDQLGAEADAYFEESPHGAMLKLEGVQPFFAYILTESGTNSINIDEEIKAGGIKISKMEETEIESRPGAGAMVFESTYLKDPFTMFKEGDYWVTDYWVGDCQDSIGQADIALTDVGNDVAGF